MLQPPLMNIDCGCVFPWLTLTQGYTFLLDLFPICSQMMISLQVRNLKPQTQSTGGELLLEDLSGTRLPTRGLLGSKAGILESQGWPSFQEVKFGTLGGRMKRVARVRIPWEPRISSSLGKQRSVGTKLASNTDFTGGGVRRRERLFQDGA